MIRTEKDILDALAHSPFHMQVLKAASALNLPDMCIAAGFVRNYIWDRLHGFAAPTPLNDIDVIYYDNGNLDIGRERESEERLRQAMPGLPWSVKNQARMHLKNKDRPYTSLEDAMAHWLETVTPVGVRLMSDNTLHLIAPLGITDLLSLRCRATPHAKSRDERLAHYRARMMAKKWWTIWPNVTVYDLQSEQEATEKWLRKQSR